LTRPASEQELRESSPLGRQGKPFPSTKKLELFRRSSSPVLLFSAFFLFLPSHAAAAAAAAVVALDFTNMDRSIVFVFSIPFNCSFFGYGGGIREKAKRPARFFSFFV
jgi:hypothetical protein